MTVMSRAWSRLTVPGKIVFTVLPLLLILVLGFALDEGFGEKPDARLRISIVNLDRGLPGKVAFPEKPWSDVVIDDLSATDDIRLEIITEREEAERLIAAGQISGGMVPKVRGAIDALRSGASEVVIADGSREGAVRMALDGAGLATRIQLQAEP